MQSQQTKKNFKRKNLHNTNLNKNRKKGFHSRGDFLLIKDEVLVYRKFLSIFLKQIADENIKDNEKEPIKKHFPSFFNEGDIYETEDEKEFEFSIQDKMNFEIISYPIKNLCKISDRNKERKYDEKSSRKEKTTFISLTNKMRERNLNSLQININRSKTMLFNEITCLKNLDKIESFEIYFPLNNFGKVVEKINKKSELLLKKMKEKKDCKERKKKMLLDNLNNQPVSLTVRLENLKSTKKEKKEDLFFNSSNNLISTEIPKKPELKLSQSLKEFKLSIEKKKSNSTRIPRPEILKEAKLTQSLKEKDIYDDKRTLFLQNFEKMIKLEKEEVETNIKLSKTLREKKSNDNFIFSNDIEKKEDERNLITHALEDNEKKKIQLNSNKNNVQMRRSLSNDTMKNTIEELEKIIEKTNKIFGSVHAKYLVEQCQNFK